MMIGVLKVAATYSPAVRSTIGDGGLNFSVRNGKRWDPAAITAWMFHKRGHQARWGNVSLCWPWEKALGTSAPEGKVSWAISTARFCHCWLYACRLSTSSSLTTQKGGLILRTASRLDAFSAYPDPARLPGGAPGGATGPPAAGPARSSRTSARPAQTSNARNR